MDSILKLREHIQAIKGYLGESKKIEEQYTKAERHLIQQQEMDDDEELFI